MGGKTPTQHVRGCFARAPPHLPACRRPASRAWTPITTRPPPQPEPWARPSPASPTTAAKVQRVHRRAVPRSRPRRTKRQPPTWRSPRRTRDRSNIQLGSSIRVGRRRGEASRRPPMTAPPYPFQMEPEREAVPHHYSFLRRTWAGYTTRRPSLAHEPVRWRRRPVFLAPTDTHRRVAQNHKMKRRRKFTDGCVEAPRCPRRTAARWTDRTLSYHRPSRSFPALGVVQD